MNTPPSKRLEQLQKLLEKEPTDPFLLYGIALEHKKAGNAPKALEFLDQVIGRDPGYCYAYHQKGMVYEGEGDVDAARQAYREGIEAARKKGDEHARGEIEAALSMLE